MSDQGSSVRPLSLAVALTVVTAVGLLAGIVGAAFGATRFVHPTLSDSALFSFLQQRQQADASPATIVRALEPARQAAAWFVPKAAPGTPLSVGQVIAGGTVFTADGWLVSHRSAFSDRQLERPADIDAVIGGRRYAVEKIVIDPYTQAVFAKVAGSNFPVATFSKIDVVAGQDLLAYDPSFGLRSLSLHRRGMAADGAEQSSERVQTMLWVSAADIPPGTVLFTQAGEAAGIIAGEGESEIAAVPFAAAAQGASGVLRGRPAERPELGVKVVSVDAALLVPAAQQVAGARVLSVARRSAAEEAGILPGDIITAVSGEEVTVRHPLADILAEYTVGATVRLSILRDGASRSLDASLGASAN